nr:ATP-binding cassette domain-containing protein [Pseudorhodobacter aquimaris]
MGSSSHEEEAVEARIDDILHLADLHRIADKKVSTMSSGEQWLLMIATALAADPKLVLLDEPAAGLISHERKTLSELIKSIRSRGIAMRPDGRQVFPQMAVLQNLRMGAYSHKDNEQAQDVEEMMDMFPILRTRAGQAAGTLSGGEQEMLAIGGAAVCGLPQSQSVEMAAEEINASGGVKVGDGTYISGGHHPRILWPQRPRHDPATDQNPQP